MIRRRGTPTASLVIGCALVLSGCARSVDGEATAAVTTTAAGPSSAVTTSSPPTTTTTTAPPEVDAEDYASSRPGVYYFASSSGKLGCAILVHTDLLTGCQGEMPAGVPRVPGSGAPDVLVPANAVLLEAGAPGEFVDIGDLALVDHSGAPQSLPAGRALVVDPFTCVVDETAAITCETDEHGFTVSDTSFETW